MNTKQEEFCEKITELVEGMSLIKLVISNRRNSASDLKSIIITIVKLRRGYNLNFVYRHSTKDITKNYGFGEGLEIISKALKDDFFNANAFGNQENITLVSNPSGKIILRTEPPTHKPSPKFSHDRAKERAIEAEGNVYLYELGLTNANGEVRREMNDKYRQINQYIELLTPYLNDLPSDRTLHIVDMGSGKGYLTFALYDYLTNREKRTVKMAGVELRAELVDTCNSIARKCNYHNLEFIQGSIGDATLETIDVLIALHACDTATDEAIFRGVRANASLIVCAPCCHKQLRKELNVTNEHKHIVKHGILMERQAEILTDTLRALIMESHGYRTKVFEFVATEHTPKNLMIVGSISPVDSTQKQDAQGSINAIKESWGISKHHLEGLLEKEEEL